LKTQSLQERVFTIVADVLEVPPGSVTPASSPETLETWDSVHHLNLVLSLEQEFHLQFEPDEIEQLNPASRIVSFIAAKTGLS
jgi:acyl carrier protein